MSTVDLFGKITPDKTKEQQYREYINSSKWKKKCEEKKESVGNKCERCGRDKLMRKLTVHHLTYENFGNEPLEDLQVLCDKCHKTADWEREQETAERNFEKLEEARFEGWATKVYGDDWFLSYDEEYVYAKYQAWCEKNDY